MSVTVTSHKYLNILNPVIELTEGLTTTRLYFC